MMNDLIMNRDDVLFVAIDLQGRLMPAMNAADELETNTAKLAEGLRILGVPSIVTQQYTKGLGPTIPSIAEALGDFEPVDKTSFSAFGAEEFCKRLGAYEARTVILCGIEAHICVQQTALCLIERGYKVYIPADCISSRKESNCDIAIRRMENEGCIITCCESILYELLGNSRTPEFKAISAIIK